VGFAGAMAVAMVMDASVGWPATLFARIGHPVTWLGALIDVLDRGATEMRCARAAASGGITAALLVMALARARWRCKLNFPLVGAVS